jgi:hypothetical protein
MKTDVGAGARSLGSKAKGQGEELAHAKMLGWLARAGLIARGVVYGLIGVLALELALGEGGKTTDQQGALQTIAHQSFGKLLLILVAVGLGGYALWRLIRAAVGHGAEQRDSTFERISALDSGIAYGLLCIAAIGILTSSGGGSESTKQTTAGVLGWTGGTVLVGVAGAILIGVAVYQAYKGLSRKFLEDAKTGEMSPSVKKAYTALGVFGHVARAVIFALIGYGLIKAALDYDPKQAVGLDGALRELAHASYGPALLGFVAAGLIGFGAYSIVDSRYRKV